MKTFLGVHYPPNGRRDGLGLFLAAGMAGWATYECGWSPPADQFYATRFNVDGDDNPPNFYTDPLQAARDHFNGQQRKWQLNPGAMSRLSNNELDIETPWHGERQVIFYLEFMRLCETVNEKAGICNYAGGNPSDNAPWTLEERWRSVLPAVKYAGEHGHFVVLHIHQQDQGNMETTSGQAVSLRHRRSIAYWLNNAAHPECVITVPPRIIFNEVSNGVGGVEPTEDQYFKSVTWLDQQCRNDPYNSLYTALCLYQAGGAEPISETMYRRLADYTSTQPEIIINQPTWEEPSMASFVFGIHTHSSPGDMQPGDAVGITASQKFNGAKFLSGDSPSHYAQIKALGIPMSNCITRLFWQANSDEPKPTPAQWCEWQRLAITEAMAAGVIWFEVHNEPNLPQEWPYSTDPHDFIAWYLQVVALLRAQHPGIKLISPGLSPQPNTPQWWIDFGAHGVFDVSDAIGAHVYWPDRATMLTPAQGLNFTPLIPISSATKPIFITEYANNINSDPDHEKGLQYVDWMNYVMAHYPTVTRAYLYIISSQTPGENISRQTIVRNGVVSAIAQGIADGAVGVPPPPTDREFDHWVDMDTGANLGTANPLTIVVNADRRIKAVTRPKVITYIFQVSADSGSATGSGTYVAGSSATLRWLPA